jgi:hypothetical protein
MTQETDEYLELLDSIRDIGMLIAALRHEKKPDDPAEKVGAARRNEIDAHVRVLEVMERHLTARKTYYIALVMLAAADVPRPAFDATATKPVGDRVRELAEELRVDLRGELAPWMAAI